MNKPTLGAVLGIIVVLGMLYFYEVVQAPTQQPVATSTQQAATSTPQQAQGDGTGISDNLTLGLDANTTVGNYLVAYNGMTVYLYANDTRNVSACAGECAAVWPPYVVPAGTRLNLQGGLDGMLSTTTRADGTIQVTYKGMPLYFYSKDTASGSTTGQGVGGVWYVVKP